MDWELLELSPKIINAVKKASLKSAKEILSLSGPELQRLARLSQREVKLLHTAVAGAYRSSPPVTALQLNRGECPSLEPGHRLSLACPVLDDLLQGGLPLRGITELAGESAAGKTQFGLQLCLSVQYPQNYGGLGSGAVYICTEDSFPIKRLRQLITQQSRLRPEVPDAQIRSLRFSDSIYIEHTADLEALQTCVSQRVPMLLERGLVRLVVVDSVAALFRTEFQADEAIERARHLLAFSGILHRLSHTYGAPVFCINQVSDVVDGPNPGRCDYGKEACTFDPLNMVPRVKYRGRNTASLLTVLGPYMSPNLNGAMNQEINLTSQERLEDSKVLPALGIAWANQVMVRLMLWRQEGCLRSGDRTSAPRKLEVVFAPHLPRASCLCGVWEEGVKGILHDDLSSQTQSPP